MKIVILLLSVLALVAMTIAAKNPICDEPPRSGGEYVEGCLLDMPVWSYDSNEKKCVPYLYGKCVTEHNQNYFLFEEDCKKACVE